MNWLQTVLSLLQLAPSILQTILSVETIFTTPKQGAAKKAVVMSALSLDGAHPTVIAAASRFIDSSVAKLNASGTFVVSAPAVAKT